MEAYHFNEVCILSECEEKQLCFGIPQPCSGCGKVPPVPQHPPSNSQPTASTPGASLWHGRARAQRGHAALLLLLFPPPPPQKPGCGSVQQLKHCQNCPWADVHPCGGQRAPWHQAVGITPAARGWVEPQLLAQLSARLMHPWSEPSAPLCPLPVSLGTSKGRAESGRAAEGSYWEERRLCPGISHKTCPVTVLCLSPKTLQRPALFMVLRGRPPQGSGSPCS